MSSIRKAVVVLVLVVALGGALAVLYSMRPSDGVQLTAGTLLLQPRPVEDFKLVDQQERIFTRENFKGRWNLLFLGFTHCPDVCPTTLSVLTAVDAGVQAKGGDIQTIFLSSDPERDTPQVMAQYLNHFNPKFVGVTGEKTQIDRLCANLGLASVKNPGANGEYTVDHSAALILIDPQMRVAAYFQPPHDVNRLVADLAAVVRQ